MTQVHWSKTKRAKQVGFGVLTATVLGALVWFYAFRPYVTTDDARIAMTLVRLAPSGVGGRIEKINVTEGSLVKTGDILLEIDHRISQANFDKAKTKATLAARELGRAKRLTAEGSGTLQSLDMANASSAAAELELKLAEVSLENTFLVAPFDGIVVQKLAEVGNLLEASQTAIVVADEKHAWIAANIEETAIGALQPGQQVRIEIDEGGKLEGKVSEIRSSVASQFALIPSDNGSGNFTKVVQRIPIKIAIADQGSGRLRAGQSVEVKIRVK